MMRPFITELKATPPAMHRFSSPVRSCKSTNEMERRVFQNFLRAGGDVPMALGQFFVGRARRPQLPADFFAKLVMLRQMVVEHADVEMKVVIAVDGQDLLREEIVIFRFAIGSQSHHFPLVAGKHVKADEVRNRGIELSERVGQLDSLQDFDVRVVALRKQRGRVFAGAVPGHDRGAIEAGDKEGAGGVALMMFEKMKTKITRTEMFANQLRMPEHPQITLAYLSSRRDPRAP